MTDLERDTHCLQPEIHARRIKLKDGRYMIFFELGELEDPQPADEPKVEDEENNV